MSQGHRVHNTSNSRRQLHHEKYSVCIIQDEQFDSRLSQSSSRLFHDDRLFEVRVVETKRRGLALPYRRDAERSGTRADPLTNGVTQLR